MVNLRISLVGKLAPDGRAFAALRRLLQWLVPNAGRLRFLSRIGRFVRFLLPQVLASQVPDSVTRTCWK